VQEKREEAYHHLLMNYVRLSVWKVEGAAFVGFSWLENIF
jgi:hypothetical protein